MVLDTCSLIVGSAFFNADTLVPFLITLFAVHKHSFYNLDLHLAHFKMKSEGVQRHAFPVLGKF